MIKDISKWLRQAPKKSEVVEIQNGPNKVKIIPQKIIESLLDELTEQNWSTRNFQFSRWEETFHLSNGDGTKPYPGKKIFCDASLELVVTYKALVSVSPYEITLGNTCTVKEIEITRVLVGAYSFDTALFGNEYIVNTAKSLCIANAASDLGRRFGKDLNPKEAAMMILGIKKPLSEDSKNKILDSLNTLSEKIKKRNTDGNLAG